MITIIDYGLGNLSSIKKAFKRLGVKCSISDKISEIENSEKLILPGVGHFKMGMERIKLKGLDLCMNELVIEKKTPILGICLGMQLMTKFSEEGNINGLGWIDAKVKFFKFKSDNDSLKIPHMGWNNLIFNSGHGIFSNITSEDLFYFVHSYYVECSHPKNILSVTNYGLDIISSFQNENIYGVQFHPEKSHEQGLEILRNFSKI